MQNENTQTELIEREKIDFDIFNKLSEIVENTHKNYDQLVISDVFLFYIKGEIADAILNDKIPHVTAKYIDPATQNNSHWGMKNAE